MYKMFDYKCLKCKHIFEKLIKGEEEVVCEKCGGECGITWTKAPNKDWFPQGGAYFRDLEKFIPSKKALKEECLRQNVTSRALGDCRNITEI